MLKSLNPKQQRTLSQLALVGYWLALFIATHLPATSPLLPNEVDNLDKLYHFLAYGILACLVATTWNLTAGPLTKRQMFFVWLGVIVFGAFDELTQIPVNRDCSVWDWLADVVGTTAGLAVFVLLRRCIGSRWSGQDENNREPMK